MVTSDALMGQCSHVFLLVCFPLWCQVLPGLDPQRKPQVIAVLTTGVIGYGMAMAVIVTNEM